MDRHADLAIVGAGIAGLAHALAAARQGRKVVVFERDARAVGASIRNFGLVWPVGQRTDLYQTALRSREIWLDIARATGMWLVESGSLTVARCEDELAVIHQLLALNPVAVELGCRVLQPRDVAERSSAVQMKGLLGALWSPTELYVDPRRTVPAVTRYLSARHGVHFEFRTAVTEIDLPRIRTTRGVWQADRVVVCSGADLDSLYPAEHAAAGLRLCKLQMMRTVPQPRQWQLGPALCGGLSLLHYPAYELASALPSLRDRLDQQYPQHRQWGIHGLVSQTPTGQLSLGDSHEYGADHDPFIREEVNHLTLDYLANLIDPPTTQIAERWHGIYASSSPGRAVERFEPASGVTIVNGLGGAGMTLSFGLAEHTIAAH